MTEQQPFEPQPDDASEVMPEVTPGADALAAYRQAVTETAGRVTARYAALLERLGPA